MRDIVFVAGARPNFMKIAPILRQMSSVSDRFRPVLVHTGQHYDASMSDIFFQQLGIRQPDVSLGVGSGGHGEQTGKILIAFEQYLQSRRDRAAGVVVVGDVNSTIACALASVKLGVPVAHVEAGLRSFDRTMPEEINRVLTDAIADVLLVTEQSGVDNLAREGTGADKVHLVGNVMIDTLLQELPVASRNTILGELKLTEEAYALVTLHRPSNVDDAARLQELVTFLERVAERLTVLFPIHPRTRARLADLDLTDRLARSVRVVDPLGYHENLRLMSKARVVITDSGGMQEETSALRVPCLTLRPNTERPVTVSVGSSTVVGNDLELCMRLVSAVLDGTYKRGGPIPLWDGHAAERIVGILSRRWS